MRRCAVLALLVLAGGSPGLADPVGVLSQHGGWAVKQGVAEGTFDVVLKPIVGAHAAVGSMSLDKSFRGDLTGTSVGQMLAFRTPQEGSAGYVAIEQVTGVLAGRHGSFVLQHSGTMDRGAANARIVVIPDSGSGELAGLTGDMVIAMTGTQHGYILHYTLPN